MGQFLRNWVKSELEQLNSNIQKILNDLDFKNTLLKNGEAFIKKYYNIPEIEPKSILDKIID